jgi:hypothetical protein
MTTRLSSEAQQAGANAIVDQLNSGYIEWRTGAQPLSANNTATGTLLGVSRFPNPAYGDANASGQAVLASAIADVVATAAGNIGHARIKLSNNATTWIDCAVTATGGGGEITVDQVAVAIGDTIKVTSISITQPAQSA